MKDALGNFDYSYESLELKLNAATAKTHLLPMNGFAHYDIEDLFDVIAFFYHHSSSDNDKKAGQKIYRDAMNPYLNIYDVGYELNEAGQIVELHDKGFENLKSAKLPTENQTYKDKLASAEKLILSRNIEDKRAAIKLLADVLEDLRPEAEKYMETQDEKNIFDIANNYHVRHYKNNQKTKYDGDIWLRWMYSYYLATIHALLRVVKKNERNPSV